MKEVVLLHAERQINFKNALPEFCEEVRSLLLKAGRHDLVTQLRDLTIIYRCPCTNPGCASFKVAGSTIGSPDAFEVPGTRRSTYTPSLNLNAERGEITVITDQLGRITAFEVLRRPDVRRKIFGL